jgi:hypothetical protein
MQAKRKRRLQPLPAIACHAEQRLKPDGSSAASERDSFEEKALKEEEHNHDGKHDQT